jgi:epoxyqueuosine reductase
MNKDQLSAFIRREATSLGFFSCGFSKAEFLEEEAPRLVSWLKNNFHGKMNYMENYFDKRLDPTQLVPGAKSVISLLYNYYTDEKQSDPDAPKISKYAFGEDYHDVIRAKLKLLFEKIREATGDINGRVFVDSAPVMDKVWAKKSGAGWIGKNSNLITKQQGSFFFIAEIILDLELEYDGPVKDYCGTCTACIDACPTEAITEPYVVDGSKCISYLTIELKDHIIPDSFSGKMDNWAFGCDICQDVCPWNRFSLPHNEPLFNSSGKLTGMKKEEWMEMTQEIFNEIFKNSPVQRTKFEGLKRNVDFLKTAPSQKH